MQLHTFPKRWPALHRDCAAIGTGRPRLPAHSPTSYTTNRCSTMRAVICEKVAYSSGSLELVGYKACLEGVEGKRVRCFQREANVFMRFDTERSWYSPLWLFGCACFGLCTHLVSETLCLTLEAGWTLSRTRYGV